MAYYEQPDHSHVHSAACLRLSSLILIERWLEGPGVSYVFPKISTFMPLSLFTVINWNTREMLWTVSPCLVLFVSFFMNCVSAGKQCREERSINGMALQGFVFKKFLVRALHECDVSCETEITCQSYNFVIGQKLCELNNRTKEARPENFRSDPTRFYKRRLSDRGMYTNISELEHRRFKVVDVKQKSIPIFFGASVRPLDVNVKLLRCLNENFQTRWRGLHPRQNEEHEILVAFLALEASVLMFTIVMAKIPL